jgi:nucleoside-diphosphate-sugar epimerase
MQTILGSGGGIGVPLARELKTFTGEIRLVSRKPEKVNASDQLFPADLTDPSQLDKAIEGSDVVYVTVGFKYSLEEWQRIWPPFMKNVIGSCSRHGARLVFFDNVYMYSRSALPFMTEESPIDPPSRKGMVRKELRQMILDAAASGKVKALIARGADFYGPDNRNSVLNIMVIDNLKKGKKAQAFGNLDKVHTYTYTPDAGKAVAVLGNTSDAFGQEWHVPTTRERITNRGWIEMIAKAMNVNPGIQKVPAWMVRVLGLFVPVMKEFPEMLYQNEEDYIFDSSKFEKRFGWGATLAQEGIRRTLEGVN